MGTARAVGRLEVGFFGEESWSSPRTRPPRRPLKNPGPSRGPRFAPIARRETAGIVVLCRGFATQRSARRSVAGDGSGFFNGLLEADDRYLLLVWWDSLESHTEGFRQSPAYQRWRALLHRFYDPFPTVEHYVVVPGACA
jgi:heme-degrading monooxygenase HmoA